MTRFCSSKQNWKISVYSTERTTRKSKQLSSTAHCTTMFGRSCVLVWMIWTVKSYVSESVDRISCIDDKNKDHLKEILLSRADWTFLWVFLAISELKNNTAMLEQVIRRPESANTWLPRGLDDIYNRILMNIPEPKRQISLKMIQCIYVAIRPLTKAEICVMVGSDDIKVEDTKYCGCMSITNPRQSQYTHPIVR